MDTKRSPDVNVVEGKLSSTVRGEADCDVLDRDDLEDGEEDLELLSATTFHQMIDRDLKDLVAEIKNKANVTVAKQPNIDHTVKGPETAEVRLYGKFMGLKNEYVSEINQLIEIFLQDKTERKANFPTKTVKKCQAEKLITHTEQC